MELNGCEGILPAAIADSCSNFQHYSSPFSKGGGRSITKNITDLCVCNENKLVVDWHHQKILQISDP